MRIVTVVPTAGKTAPAPDRSPFLGPCERDELDIVRHEKRMPGMPVSRQPQRLGLAHALDPAENGLLPRR